MLAYHVNRKVWNDPIWMWSQRNTGLIALATCSSHHQNQEWESWGVPTSSGFLIQCLFQCVMFMCFLTCFTFSSDCVFFWNVVFGSSGPPYYSPQLKTGEQANESSPQHTRLPCKSAPKDTITTSWKHWNTRTVIFLLRDEWKAGTGGMGSQAWSVMPGLSLV